MSAIFSVQNLQTFLRRKNLRAPPSRGGPPGPERLPPPPNRGRSPPGRGPSGRVGRSETGDAALVSSAITLLKIGCQWPVVSGHQMLFHIAPQVPEMPSRNPARGNAVTPLPVFPQLESGVLPPLPPVAH